MIGDALVKHIGRPLHRVMGCDVTVDVDQVLLCILGNLHGLDGVRDRMAETRGLARAEPAGGNAGRDAI